MNFPAKLLTVAVLIAAALPALAADTAAVTGKVLFSGTPPKRRVILTDADPQCSADHPLLNETVIVNDNGTLRNVFVYVKTGLEGKTFPVPPEPVVLNQKGCQYQPHVLGLQVGQTLLINNSDPTFHTIHGMPTQNEEFNDAQPSGAAALKHTFAKPEVMMKFKCEVHPWMTAHIGVLPHPFFSVTGDDGTFAIKNLPAGTYVIEAWHEKYGTQTATITVADGETKSTEFTFSPP